MKIREQVAEQIGKILYKLCGEVDYSARTGKGNSEFFRLLRIPEYTTAILSLSPLAELLAIYERTVKDCPECDKGKVYVPDEKRMYPIRNPKLVQCPNCRGTGKVYDIDRVVVLDEAEALAQMIKGRRVEL